MTIDIETTNLFRALDELFDEILTLNDNADMCSIVLKVFSELFPNDVVKCERYLSLYTDWVNNSIDDLINEILKTD